MKTVSLGSTGLSVSEMCMGAMNFGTAVGREASFRLLDAYLDHGGTFIDTSNNYAHWYPGATGDESEALLGEWLASRKVRDKVVIATKVGFDRHGAGQGLKAHQIIRWCEESLRKLRTDVIDLYYAHVDDPDTPLEETMGAFARLLASGKIRSLGASNFYTWRLCQAREVCLREGLPFYGVLQQKYTYLYMENGRSPYPFNESASDEKLMYLAKQGMPLVAYSCMAGGGYADNSRFSPGYIKGRRLNVLNDMAREKNVPAQQLVLAWLCNSWRFKNRPQIIPLFSASSVEHLAQNIAASEIAVTEAELAALNEA